MENGINVMVVRESLPTAWVERWLAELATTSKRPCFAIDPRRLFFVHPDFLNAPSLRELPRNGR
jgi:hypothetical protein